MLKRMSASWGVSSILSYQHSGRVHRDEPNWPFTSRLIPRKRIGKMSAPRPSQSTMRRMPSTPRRSRNIGIMATISSEES